ncbi:hypothetical protein OAN24_00920 [Pseudodesulfovibrio sp.]|nr:hypothetical protein [Pseudodesulfovibrio sp.]
MSTTPLDLPILISQLPYVAKIAHAEKAGPEIKQQLFGPLIQEHIRKNESKVQEVDKKEKTDPVDRDGQQQGQQAHPDTREKNTETEEESSDTSSANPSPWAGNIVNVKI